MPAKKKPARKSSRPALNPKAKKIRLPETDDGTILFNVPFPKNLKDVKGMAPILIKQPYSIDYLHSFGQDSPFFAALANGKLISTKCPGCKYKYATPKGHCMYCGTETEWFELPQIGYIHTWTTCHFGSEEFLPQCPFNLILVEWDGVGTLFLARLVGADEESIKVGMPVKAMFKRNAKFKPTDVYFIPA